MKNKIWGVLFLVGSILIILLLLFIKKDSKKEIVEDKVTLKWYINYSWFDTEWGKNIVSKKISEKIGVNVEFVVPKGDESEKLNSMINSDTLPDLITLGWWECENQEMIEKDKVYSYQQLEETYHTGFFEIADEESVKWYTKEDGNLCGYPNYSYSWTDFQENKEKISSHQNFLVRKDIYEAIGSPDMTTPEGFVAAVKKAKEMFPEVNGKPLIPIGSDQFSERGSNSFDIWLQNFLAVPYEKDGKYYDRNTDQEYLNWLKVFRQLGEEGYLNPEIFIDNRMQLSEKLVDGRYFCLFYQNTDIEEQEKKIYKENPDRIYIAVEGPRNSKGEDPVLSVPGINGWTVTYISKNCKYPKKALELLNYMLSEEGQKLIYLGEEGTMYHMVDQRAVINQEVADVLNTDREEYDSIYGADDTYWMVQSGEMQMEAISYEADYIRQLYEWTNPYAAYTGQYELDFGDDMEMSAIYHKLNQIWSDALIDLLLAPSEEAFDLRVEQYKEERNKIGYHDFEEAATELIQKNKEKLGIKE